MLLFISSFAGQVIRNVDDWNNIKSNMDYTISSTIDFTNQNIKNLKLHNCTIDGQNNLILNLPLHQYIYNDSVIFTALFSEAYNVTLKNIYFMNITVIDTPISSDANEQKQQNTFQGIYGYSALFGYAANVKMENVELINVNYEFKNNQTTQSSAVSIIFYKAQNVSLNHIIIINSNINISLQSLYSTAIIATQLDGHNCINNSYIQSNINLQSQFISTISINCQGQLNVSNLWLNVIINNIANEQCSLLILKGEDLNIIDAYIHANLTFKQMPENQQEKIEIHGFSKKIQNIDVNGVNIFIQSDHDKHIISLIGSKNANIKSHNVRIMNSMFSDDKTAQSFKPLFVKKNDHASHIFLNRFIEEQKKYEAQINDKLKIMNITFKNQRIVQGDNINQTANQEMENNAINTDSSNQHTDNQDSIEQINDQNQTNSEDKTQQYNTSTQEANIDVNQNQIENSVANNINYDQQDPNQWDKSMRCTFCNGFCYYTQEGPIFCDHCYAGYAGEECTQCQYKYDWSNNKCTHVNEQLDIKSIIIIWVIYAILLVIIKIIFKILCCILCCRCCK